MKKLKFLLILMLAIGQSCWFASCGSEDDPIPQGQPADNNTSSTNDDDVFGVSHERTQDSQEPLKLEYSLNTDASVIEPDSPYIMTLKSNNPCDMQVHCGDSIIAAKKDTKILTVILPTSQTGKYNIIAVATAGNITSETLTFLHCRGPKRRSLLWLHTPQQGQIASRCSIYRGHQVGIRPQEKREHQQPDSHRHIRGRRGKQSSGISPRHRILRTQRMQRRDYGTKGLWKFVRIQF